MAKFHGRPEAANPSERKCDWCDKPGAKALELPGPRKRRTGLFLYPCQRHIRTAEEAILAREGKLEE